MGSKLEGKMDAAHRAGDVAGTPLFFATPAEFRSWLERNSSGATELIVGFHKVGSGTPSMTWPQSVDEALCFGWIDAVRKRIDEQRYQIRFTPRKPGSTWSAINIERVAVLTEQGRMRPAGLAAFAHRSEAKSRTYAYEQRDTAVLDLADEKAFRKNRAAWAFFEAQPPGYRKTLIWRIVSAKQSATRQRRLQPIDRGFATGRAPLTPSPRTGDVDADRRNACMPFRGMIASRPPEENHER